MADYKSYQKNQDGSFTFSDAAGNSVNAIGPAAWQKAQQLDIAQQASATPPPAAAMPATIREATAPRADMRLAYNDQGAPSSYGGDAPPAPPPAVADVAPPMAPEPQPKEIDLDAWQAEQSQLADYNRRQAEHDRASQEKPYPEREAAHEGPQLTAAQQQENEYRRSHGLPEIEPQAPAEAGHGAPAGHGAAPAAHGKVDPATLQGAGGGATGGEPVLNNMAGGGGGGQLVKGGWRDMSASRQRVEMPAEYAQHVRENAEQQKRDAEAEAQTESIIGQETGRMKARQFAEQQAYDAEVQANEAQRRNEVKARFDRIQQLNNELANEKLDSKRFWSNKTNGERMAASIAVALGAAAQTLSGGGPNNALQILNKAVDDDIAEQKFNLEHKRDSVKAQESLLNQYRLILGDDRAAEQAAKAAMLSRASQELDQYMTGGAADARRAIAVQKFKTQIDANAKSLIDESGKQTVAVASQNIPDRYVGGAAQSYVFDEDVSDKNTVRDMNGNVHVFGDEGAAKEANKEIANLRTNRDMAAQLRELVNNPKTAIPGTAENARAKVLSMGIIENSKNAGANMPRINKEGVEQAEKGIAGGDPTAITNFAKSDALSQYISNTEAQAAGIIQQSSTGTVKRFSVKDKDKGKVGIHGKYRRTGGAPGVAPKIESSERVGE